MVINEHDTTIIRDLSKKVRDIAALPIMEERRSMWKRHHRLERVRPMVLVFPEGSWRELLPDSSLECEGEAAREIEWELKRRIYEHDHFNQDKPVESRWVVAKVIDNSGWGLESRYIESSNETGAWGFDPVINEPADLEKLHYPEITYDPEETQRRLEFAEELLGDILEVKLKGVSRISFHLMSIYCRLRGLEQVMWDMYDNAEMLHRAMSILEEGHKRIIKQYEELDLLDLNNDETYHSSGGVGYTDELPRPDFDGDSNGPHGGGKAGSNPDGASNGNGDKAGSNGGRVRPCDMWASAEAQEMAQVSPAMHAEFILPYEKRLLKPFGLNGYGCCEDLTNKMEDVFTIPNIRRISISPWANVARCAEKLKGDYIFSWKPHPGYIAGDFSPEGIRDYIKKALESTRGCVMEMILKDTHTCQHQPDRFDEWTGIAMELAEQY